MSKVLVADCLLFACEATGISKAEVLGPGRTHKVVRARHLGMWLARRFTKASFQTIARRFCRKDHTTVHGAIKIMKRHQGSSPAFARQLADDEANFLAWSAMIAERRAATFVQSAFVATRISTQQTEATQ